MEQSQKPKVVLEISQTLIDLSGFPRASLPAYLSLSIPINQKGPTLT